MKRQLIQHRLKTAIIGQTGWFQPVTNVVKRVIDSQLGTQLARFTQGWTGLENCGVVTFNGQNVTYNGQQVFYNP